MSIFSITFIAYIYPRGEVCISSFRSQTSTTSHEHEGSGFCLCLSHEACPFSVLFLRIVWRVKSDVFLGVFPMFVCVCFQILECWPHSIRKPLSLGSIMNYHLNPWRKRIMRGASDAATIATSTITRKRRKILRKDTIKWRRFIVTDISVRKVLHPPGWEASILSSVMKKQNRKLH